MAWDREQVQAFDAGKEDILVLARSLLEGIATAVSAGAVAEFRATFRQRNAPKLVGEGLQALRIDSPALAADITELARSFLDQFGIRKANLRIEMVRTQSCPKFHCDNVRVRLVTTYLGPTTEYQHAGDETVHAAPLYALVFLKGHKHPTHQDGVRHRSPEVPVGEKRLCVVIDY
jgi:hypothetical protein